MSSVAIKYQVRYTGAMSDEPMSELFDNYSDAAKKLNSIKDEMQKTWKTPDTEGLKVCTIRAIRKDKPKLELKLHGLKKACSVTKDLCSKNGYGWHVAIYLNTLTGEVTTWEHPDGNSWKVIKDPNIRFVSDVRQPMTMIEIKDMITERMS